MNLEAKSLGRSQRIESKRNFKRNKKEPRKEEKQVRKYLEIWQKQAKKKLDISYTKKIKLNEVQTMNKLGIQKKLGNTWNNLAFKVVQSANWCT